MAASGREPSLCDAAVGHSGQGPQYLRSHTIGTIWPCSLVGAATIVDPVLCYSNVMASALILTTNCGRLGWSFCELKNVAVCGRSELSLPD